MSVWEPAGFLSSTAARHCIITTVQTVRRQKAVPCRTDSSAFLLPDLQFCSFSQNSPLQSAFSFSQNSALQSALFRQPTFRSPVSSVYSVNIPLSSRLCYVTSNQWRCQCHVPTNINIFPLHQSRRVTLPAFHCEGLWSTPSHFMCEQWCSNSSTNCLQRTGLHFTSHLFVYVFLLSVAVDPLYKQYSSVIVPLFLLT